MDLWIRSQDRESLKKINTGFYLKQDLSNYAKGEVIFIVGGGDKLGEYETKERALEVLDEIQNILKPKYILNTSSIKPDGDFYEENGVIFQNYDANAKIEELSTVVYKMPEK